MKKMYEVTASINGRKVVDIVNATDKYDAVDVFEISHNCWNNGKKVEIKSVEEVEE